MIVPGYFPDDAVLRDRLTKRADTEIERSETVEVLRGHEWAHADFVAQHDGRRPRHRFQSASRFSEHHVVLSDNRLGLCRDVVHARTDRIDGDAKRLAGLLYRPQMRGCGIAEDKSPRGAYRQRRSRPELLQIDKVEQHLYLSRRHAPL